MRNGLPPGPKNRWLTTVQFARDPTGCLRRWKARYGDPFTVRAVNGDVVTTARPELVKTIFARDPEDYGPFAADALIPMIGAHSIFVQQGPAHRRQRRLLMPPFHGARMRHYAEVVAEVTRRQAGAASSTTMMALAQRISLEVILRAVFGANDAAEARSLEREIARLIKTINPLVVFIPALQRRFGGLGPFARFERQRRATDALLYARIAATRTALERGEERTDVLSLLLSARDEAGQPMADEEIRDHLATLLFAGHETTAISLAWAVDLVGRHPPVKARLQAEASSGETSYVAAVAKETLRLYPPLTEALRLLRRPMTLGAWRLPAGAVVSPSIYLLHRDAALYDDPDCFRPERFIDSAPSADHYLPFGGGHRRCIGAAFAQFELEGALHALFDAFEIELVSGRAPALVRRNVTVAPSDNVPVQIKPRVNGR